MTYERPTNPCAILLVLVTGPDGSKNVDTSKDNLGDEERRIGGEAEISEDVVEIDGVGRHHEAASKRCHMIEFTPRIGDCRVGQNLHLKITHAVLIRI